MIHTTELFKVETLNQLAVDLKNNGLRVFYSDDPHWRTFFYFSDGKNIGYVQRGDYGHGVRFTTVHKPCRECGTGFGLQDWDEPIDEPTIKDAKKAFVLAPKWAKPNDVKAVRKYADLDEFLNYQSQFHKDTLEL